MTVQIVDGEIEVTLSADHTRITLSQATGPQGPTGPTGAAYAPGELRSDADSGITYLGRAAVDAGEDEEAWTISRYEVSGDDVLVTHAADVAWDDRLTAVYT